MGTKYACGSCPFLLRADLFHRRQTGRFVFVFHLFVPGEPSLRRGSHMIRSLTLSPFRFRTSQAWAARALPTPLAPPGTSVIFIYFLNAGTATVVFFPQHFFRSSLSLFFASNYLIFISSNPSRIIMQSAPSTVTTSNNSNKCKRASTKRSRSPTPPSTPTDDASALNTSSVDEKPACSYQSLIRFAIENSAERKLTLSEIYQWVLEHCPYYRTAGSGWKVSSIKILSQVAYVCIHTHM